jgi:Mrp family chromosome partitioning ATPase
MPNQQDVLIALSSVMDPELNRSLTDLQMIKDIKVEKGGKVRFTIALTMLGCPLREKISNDARQAVLALPGVKDVDIQFRAMTDEERKAIGLQPNQPSKLNQFNKIKQVIAIMSGKGGVGKSSVTALLGSALACRKQRVGILDADVTGASIPKLFGMPPGGLRSSEQGILPGITSTGIKVISINLLLPDEDTPVVWRGPMIAGAIRQFWTDVLWGSLDVLLVDLPPGTSDAALTVMTSLPVNGVIMVTTPQQLAAMVVRKAMNMLHQINVPIMGLVENMSYYTCPDTGKRHEIFGPSHAEEVAVAADAPVLARLPIDPLLTTLGDTGRIEEARLPEMDSLAEKVLAAVHAASTA